MKRINNYINEATHKSDKHDIGKWINTDKSKYIKLTDDNLDEITKLIRTYMEDNTCPEKLFNRFDKDTIINIGGYIIEADLYTAAKDAIAQFIENHIDLKEKIEHEFGKDYIKSTELAGRGLKVKSENNDKYPVYWDFSIFGIDEKFEIKTICNSGYHTGGFTYTDNQRKFKDFILIPCKYTVDEESKTYKIDINSITLRRK